VTADHLDSKSDLNVSHEGHRFALVVKDVWSKLFSVYPVINKSGELTRPAMQHFIGGRRVKLCYTDGSGELEFACKRLGISHDVSDPGIPATNAIIERAIGIIKQGARTTLIRAGFPPCFWSRAAACFCFHSNCDNTRGESAYFKTHDVDHSGLAIPFGARVAYLPVDTHDLAKSTWDAPARIGIFAGYEMHSGYLWPRRYLVWDISEFEGLPLLATKIVAGSLATPHSTKQVKVLPNTVNDDWVFPLKRRFDEETMTIEGRERAQEQEDIRGGPPTAPPDFDPGAVQVDRSVTRDAVDDPKDPTIDEKTVDAERRQWHLDDLQDRKLPIGSFIDIDGVLKKKDRKGRAYPM
jgi:hypothetical protein